MSRAPRRHRPLWTLLATAVVALSAAACTKEPTVVATLSHDDAEAIVRNHADEVLTLTGWAGFSKGTVLPVPCSRSDGSPSDTAYRASGSFQLIVPLEQQRDVVERLAQGWSRLGYTVSPVTYLPSGGAQVTAVTTDEFFVDMTLGSGQPPAMALIIVTACYSLAS
jgi:hypothetical protein